jgi:deazaflavin-dependent oxidoreductase (nitroreductase family)
MAEAFLYLTTKGRTTGLPRSIEIWFVEHEGAWYIVSEMRDRANWVKNVQREPRVTFSVGARRDRGAVVPETRGRARIVDQSAEPELARSVAALMDAKYGWSDGLIVEIAKQ